MKSPYAFLDSLGISYTKHEHPALFTVEQAKEHYHKMPGGHTKNLFLRNKNGDKHYLVIVESLKKTDLDWLKKYFQESKLSFASPERLMKYLGLTPGAVSALGLINDENHEVRVLVDTDLFKLETIYAHPNVNTATLGIPKEGFRKFLENVGNHVEYARVEERTDK
ncbi:prolyl-tRNA synthetase associated domain-containing protein [Candidatus Peregrinibacteria bacterium]|nr:prolyl-tRNA synthetase associated domain-containing protein [Candidatus Peregrinibacteria bacterium]